ncbi:DUF4142 domain-containing protein [Luteimonas deserti]|uniref:DUF4142 domain-containing protein n=1 Tax=Luteimonas deserti TaxID=2752306 RepID=A0A7Z0TT95_9GAMM|nr:DUF4142 domain-containing protein [Luteimonas deserti]NYZ61581.1 DUF4142 domain-containing protein [Luteimonas deserti]
MKPTLTLLGAALALALAGCNNQDPGNDTTGLSVDTTAVAQGIGEDADVQAAAEDGRDGSALAEADRAALQMVQTIDRHEIAAADAALAKGVTGDVHRYAETLRAGHTRNEEATQRLLGSGAAGAYAAAARDTAAVRGTSRTEASRSDTSGALGTHPEPADAHEDVDTVAGASASPEIQAMRDTFESERTRLATLEGDAFASAWTHARVSQYESTLTRLDDVLIPSVRDEAVARHLRATREMVAAHLDAARGLEAD